MRFWSLIAFANLLVLVLVLGFSPVVAQHRAVEPPSPLVVYNPQQAVVVYNPKRSSDTSYRHADYADAHFESAGRIIAAAFDRDGKFHYEDAQKALVAYKQACGMTD